MRFYAQEFLDSTLGKHLQLIVKDWNAAIYNDSKGKIESYKTQWNLYRKMFEYFYKKDADVKKTHDSFGVVIKGKKEEWLIKFDRAGIMKDRYYINRNKKCECYLCEYENICPYVRKLQRLPRTSYGGLAECWKLPENKEE